MARNVIWIDYPTVVSGVFTSISNGTEGQRWDHDTDQALEAHLDGDWADYVVGSTQVGSTQEWAITIPPALPPGRYALRVYDGAAPALGDSTIGSMELFWDGVNSYINLDLLSYLEVLTQGDQDIYAVFRNSAGQYWHTGLSVYQAFNAANWGEYAIAGTEVTDADLYRWTSIPAGAMIYEIRAQQSGGEALTDPRITAGSLRL